jgi:hypothetical protein
MIIADGGALVKKSVGFGQKLSQTTGRYFGLPTGKKRGWDGGGTFLYGFPLLRGKPENNVRKK